MTDCPLSLRERLAICRGIDPFPDQHQQALIEWAADQFLLPRLYAEHSAAIDQWLDTDSDLGHLGHLSKRKVSGLLVNHLEFYRHDHQRLFFESTRVVKALSHHLTPIILLKGGAYSISGHKASCGRRVSDLDILVYESDLTAVEEALLSSGWHFDEKTDNAYDQRYYRQYMHELPPLRHKERGSVLDVHHRILPRTSRITYDMQKLFDAAVPIANSPYYRLSDSDMVLHACAHHFIEGDGTNGPRAIVEILDLLENLSLDDLVSRARETGLSAALYYGLHLANRYGGQGDLFSAKQHLKSEGSTIVLNAMIQCLDAEQKGHTAYLSKFFLQIRAHYLRMPSSLLMRHASYKIKQALLRRYWYLIRRFQGKDQ